MKSLTSRLVQQMLNLIKYSYMTNIVFLENYATNFLIAAICSETSWPFFVSLIIFILPFFSKLTSPYSSRVCRIFTA